MIGHGGLRVRQRKRKKAMIEHRKTRRIML